MISSSLEILRDIAIGNGPKQRIIALGYAGWAPNQLENEIANNLWLITHATPELVLGSNDTIKWSQAMSSLGIRFDNLTPSFGHS
jgi:putative transcriptional regulator